MDQEGKPKKHLQFSATKEGSKEDSGPSEEEEEDPSEESSPSEEDQGESGNNSPWSELGSGAKKRPKRDPALSEAKATTWTDPPPNPRRLTRLFTQKEDYKNFKELIEVVGHIVLPSYQTKDL